MNMENPMQRMMKNLKQNAALPLSLLAALTMVGCNETGSSSLGSSEDEHEHAESDHPGRLVIAAGDDGSQLYMYDLEANALLPGTLTLDYDASALYTSPGKRFVLAIQRDNDQVQVIDGGLYLHDGHVDEVIPSFAGTLTGPAPTHFRVHGEQAALFYDGDAANAVMAQVELLTDESLETASSVASQTLASAHHGVAEPRGDVLLATFRTAASGLPETVDVYHQHGDHYHKEDTIAPTCPDLHGAGSNEDYSVFGCSDGVLIVHQDGEDFTAEKITNATLGLAAGERVGSFDSHHELPHFVAYAGDRILIIHPDHGDADELDWTEGAAVSLDGHALDGHGEHLILLDDSGDLRIFDTADWSEHAHVENAIDPETAAPPASGHGSRVSMAVGGEPAQVFMSHADSQSIIVVDVETGTLATPLNLTFTPSKLTWVGLSSEEGDHDHEEDGHDHDDDHDHDH
jgi:hypothetical protein